MTQIGSLWSGAQLNVTHRLLLSVHNCTSVSLVIHLCYKVVYINLSAQHRLLLLHGAGPRAILLL